MTPDEEVLSSLDGIRVVVVGDLIVDEYIFGGVSRLSPEAPVPVVEVRERKRAPGGAGNVARNLSDLGGVASLVSVVGSDEPGEWLFSECRRLGIDTTRIQISRERPTTFKQRVVARTQQIVRLDTEVVRPLGDDLTDRLCEQVRGLCELCDVVVVSDYDKGVLSEGLLEVIWEEASRGKKPIVVDPNVGHFFKYGSATVVTPNNLQLERVSGRRIRTPEELYQVGCEIHSRLGGAALLVTRGEEGMSLFSDDDNVLDIPTVAREVYDVTGAGDTVVAALALCLGAGMPLSSAARIANAAAGLVVGKRGTASVSRRELAERLSELDLSF